MFFEKLKKSLKNKNLVLYFGYGIALVLALYLGFQFVSYYQEQKSLAEFGIGENSSFEPEGTYPDALYDYDMTQYRSMFTVLGMDKQNKTMELRFVYPAKYMGKEILAKVNCALKDTTLLINDDLDTGPVSSTVEFYEDARIVPGKTTMQGVCEDELCRKITKYCEFWI